VSPAQAGQLRKFRSKPNLDKGEAAFDMWWSQLSEMLQSIERGEGGRHTLKKRDTHEILEELLELVKTSKED